MTTGTFTDAIGLLEGRFVEETISFEKTKHSRRAASVHIAAVCAALLLLAGAALLFGRIKTKKDEGLVSSNPQIVYFLAITDDKVGSRIDGPIKLTLRIGASEGFTEIKLWSYSDLFRIKDSDPLYLYAENGDFDPEKLVIRYPDYSISKDGTFIAKAEDLPFQMPLVLETLNGEDGEGRFEISVSLSGVGQWQKKTLVVHYEIRGGVFYLKGTEEGSRAYNDEKN